MSDLGQAFPIENWMTDRVVDPELKYFISRARAEFQGASDVEVKTLWQDFEAVLLEWSAQNGLTCPTHRLLFEFLSTDATDPPGGRSVNILLGSPTRHPDFFALFTEFSRRRGFYG